MINKTRIFVKSEQPFYISIETNEPSMTLLSMIGIERALQIVGAEFDISSENIPENEEDVARLEKSPHLKKFDKNDSRFDPQEP